jgi:hypothetical protein
MTKRSTVVESCKTNRILFLSEYSFRDSAKRETDFDREVWLFHCANLTLKDRFRHVERCPVCLAAEERAR